MRRENTEEIKDGKILWEQEVSARSSEEKEETARSESPRREEKAKGGRPAGPPTSNWEVNPTVVRVQGEDQQEAGQAGGQTTPTNSRRSSRQLSMSVDL